MESPMPMIVSLKNIVKRYTRGKQSVEVLHALNLDVPQGEFLALMGPSGSVVLIARPRVK
jgi:putative ABC transport system ATP-binding protein